MRTLLALLPLAALAAAVRGLARRGWRPGAAGCGGAVVWGAALVALSEGLGAGRALRPLPIALGWAVVAAALVALGRRAPPGPDRTPSTGRRSRRFAADELAALAPIGGILALTLLVALAATPNNWDSMVYHLPRVRQWEQQASLAHFATHNLKQIYFPPFAELAMLHLRLLAGGDALVNLVQWLAFAGVVAGGAEVARELGADRRGRRLAALFAATIPMAILQATSTQNDLVAAFWTVAAVALALRLRRRREPLVLALGAGACGLLLLTKPTGVVVAAPFLAWALAGAARRARRRRGLGARSLGAVAGALLLAAALNAGHWQRNRSLFGSPLGPAETAEYVNRGPLLETVASNGLRNGASLVATPWESWNRALADATRAVHRGLGLERGGPIPTFDDTSFRIPARWRHEHAAGAPLHLALLTLAVGASARISARRRGARGAYLVCLVTSFVLFAAVFRWQTENARLLLPALVLAAPWTATALAARPRGGRFALVASLALVVAAAPPLVANQIRPLLGGESIFVTPPSRQLFASRPHEGPHLLALLSRLRSAGCDRVGLVSTDASYEYPVWVLLEGISPGGPEIRHLRVRNASRRAPTATAFEPCAVLRLWGGIRRGELHEPSWLAGAGRGTKLPRASPSARPAAGGDAGAGAGEQDRRRRGDTMAP